MIPTWMSAEQAWQWQISLQLRLTQVHGDAFQDFFSNVMAMAHGDDFERIRPFGSLGDKGCDGYLASAGQVFQCFGKLNDAAVNVSVLVTKIETDYAKAATKLALIMKEWHFVHNLVDGLPIEARLKLADLGSANPQHKIGTIGPAGIEDRVFGCPEGEIVRLLGPAGTAEHTKNMRVEVVADVIAAVMAGVDTDITPNAYPKPVPFDKMTFNKIPTAWRQMLEAASRNSGYIEDYLNAHHDPEFGSRLAGVFRNRYEDLKAQQLSSAAIMAKLYEGVIGIGISPLERQVAAQALLAFLFEACDIFEDDPAKVSA
jgi:hypothetical protein